MKDISLYETVPPLENDYTLKIRVYKRKDALLSHWHEHIELLYFTYGGCTVTAGGASYDVSAGDLVVVNPAQLHSFTATQTVEYYCILIYPAFFHDVSLSGRLIKNCIKDDPVVKAVFENIKKEYAEEQDGKDMALKGLVYSLLTHLLRSHAEKELPERNREAQQRLHERMRSITDYIAENYMYRLTTVTLAARSFMSEAHFCRSFRAVTGKSPVEYVNDYRVQKAALLLTETNEYIADIATRVGFPDVNYFSRVFKKIKAISPTEYRKKRIEGRKRDERGA